MISKIDLKKIEGIPGSKLACAISTKRLEFATSMLIVCGFINEKNEELTISPILEIEIEYFPGHCYPLIEQSSSLFRNLRDLQEQSSTYFRVTNGNHDDIVPFKSSFFSNENAKTMLGICKTLLNEDHSTRTAKLLGSCFRFECASTLSLESIIILKNEIFKQKLSSCFPRLLKCLKKIIESSNNDEEADGIEMRPMQ